MKQFFFCFGILIGISCNHAANNELEYRHTEELNLYLHEIHRFRFPEHSTAYLLVIPVGGCSNCTAAAFEMAQKYIHRNDFIVLITANTKKDFIPYRNYMVQLSANTLIDSAGRDNHYELGIFGPVLFKLKTGKVHQFNELNLQNIKTVFYENFGY